jgi:hypothetical protein
MRSEMIERNVAERDEQAARSPLSPVEELDQNN